MGITELKYSFPPQYRPYESERPKTLPFRHIFEAKDNEEVFMKTLIASKKTAIFGVGMSFMDIIGFTQCQTLPHALSRVIFWVPPVLGAGAAYVVTTSAVASLRNKPDCGFNHMFGGFAFGAVYGLKFRTLGVGLPLGLMMGLIGWVHKEYAKIGFKWYEFNSDIDRRNVQGHAFSKWCDFSSERSKQQSGYGKTWVKELPSGSETCN